MDQERLEKLHERLTDDAIRLERAVTMLQTLSSFVEKYSGDISEIARLKKDIYDLSTEVDHLAVSVREHTTFIETLRDRARHRTWLAEWLPTMITALLAVGAAVMTLR